MVLVSSGSRLSLGAICVGGLLKGSHLFAELDKEVLTASHVVCCIGQPVIRSW